MGLKLISESATDAVSLLEIKHHLRLSTSSTGEDLLLSNYLSAARHVAENRCNRSFVIQTWELTRDCFPTGGIQLTRPLATFATSVVLVQYVNESSVLTVLPATAYTIDDRSEPGWIFPSEDNDWPDTLDVVNAVTVTYETGDSTAPEAVKAWIQIRAGVMYENREALVIDRNLVQELPRNFIDGLLDPYVVVIDV
jgi:uncharacterized phiE125 gp8 family phage protein